MVFGWGKKKQERPMFTDDAPKVKEVTLDDIPDIISDVEELRKTQTLSDINTLRNGTNPLIDDLIKIGNLLEKDDLDVDDIDRHLAIIVVRGKKQVIDIIKKDVVPLPKISTLDDAEKLDQLLNQILKKVGDMLGRQTRVIHIFAKKYAHQLKENLEIMQKNHMEIHKLLKNFESTKLLSDDIRNTITQIKDSANIRKEQSQKVTKTDMETKLVQKNMSDIQDSIDKIYSSDQYKKYQDLKDTIDVYKKQRIILRDKVNSQFTKISRPLSRYQYVSALEKDQKKLLEKLVADPFDAITLQDRDMVITILENIQKGTESGAISVKDINKTRLQLAETKESLDGFVQQISEYNKRQSELQKQLQTLMPDRLDSLKKELQRCISVKDQTILKSRVLQEEISEIDSEIPNLVLQIEKKTRELSNVRYQIAVD